MAKRHCKTGRERDQPICFICQSDAKSPFCKQPSNVLRKDRNLINFIFVVCLELMLWFLFLLWNLYCGFIDQNDNEIPIFFSPHCHPGLFLWWVCPRNIYSIRYGLTQMQAHTHTYFSIHSGRRRKLSNKTLRALSSQR